MKTFILTLIVLVALLPTFYGNDISISPDFNLGQEPKQILDKLRDFYSKHPYIYHELSYRMFPDHKSSIPSSTEKGIFIQKGEIRYSQLATIESLTTSSYSIGVDHDDKVIMISNIIHIPATDPLQNVESVIDPETRMMINQISANRSELRFEMDEGEIEQMQIVYDPSTFQIQKMIFNYRRSIPLSADEDDQSGTPRLEVEYSTTLFEETNPEILKVSTYISGQGKHWRVTPKFHDYELINNIQEYPRQNN